MKDIKQYLLSIFFPKRCKYCGCVIDMRDELCNTCEKTLMKIEGEICKRCGVSKDLCSCGGKKSYYEGICAPFYYEGAVSKAIWNLKFRNKTEFAETLAEEMARCFQERLSEYDFDFCTFVPSAKEDIKKRGYNQADLLARQVGTLIGIPCKELLIKNRPTKPQHTLPEMKRSGNLLGCFEVKDGEEFENARILLCDDVKTTGATLNECAKTLLIGGASEVFCLTAAITSRHKEE